MREHPSMSRFVLWASVFAFGSSLGCDKVAEKQAAEAEERAEAATKRADEAEQKLADVEKRATDAETKLAEAEKRASEAEQKASDAAKSLEEALLAAEQAKLADASATTPAPGTSATAAALCDHVIVIMTNELGDAIDVLPQAELDKMKKECVLSAEKEKTMIGEAKFNEQAACVLKAKNLNDLEGCEPT